MKQNINNLSFSKTITKPWGEEIIYTPDNLKYTFKKIKINNGCRLSLQSHTDKTETFILISGFADLVVGTDINQLKTISLNVDQSYNIPVGLIHRLVGVKDAVILEASTPETGTTIRYQDDYHRPDETEKLRKEINRGWQSNK
jgi:mannose-6-phosphate isomerase-like protein (cupin superfamily)